MRLNSIYNAVVDGNAAGAVTEVNAALKEGYPAEEVLHKACIRAMGEVGRQFERGEKFVPEMLIAARAMQGAVDVLRPLLIEEGVETVGTVVIGTVAGDLHDIGKNLVGMMLEGAGFEIIDLGTNVAPQKFVEAVQIHRPDIVGLSALLTTTMPAIAQTLAALREAGVRDHVKVLVGGAPITQDFANQIGADGFAQDAGSAARLACELLGISE